MARRKIFKAASDTVCEKAFIEEWDNRPDGWYWTSRDALAAWTPPPRIGRPPKAKPAEEAEA